MFAFQDVECKTRPSRTQTLFISHTFQKPE